MNLDPYSWTPTEKDVYGQEPINTSNMYNTVLSTNTFSQALAALKDGLKVQRSGWNGKGMFLSLYSPAKEHPSYADTFQVTHGEYPLLPFILIKTADNMWVPWLASQTDILAEDWSIIEN